MTSATERLRALLTERGVEWRGGLPTETMVEADGLDLLYVALPDGRVRAFIRNYLTPERAVEATLGAGTCHVTFERIFDGHPYKSPHCSECGQFFAGYVRGKWPRYCPNCGRRCVG